MPRGEGTNQGTTRHRKADDKNSCTANFIGVSRKWDPYHSIVCFNAYMWEEAGAGLATYQRDAERWRQMDPGRQQSRAKC